jgi:metallo-beta-lactamase class B
VGAIKLAVTVACLLSPVALPQKSTRFQPDKAIVCGACDAWNARREPFRIFGNTYYVGVAGLSSILVVSDKGHILLDGGLPQSAALIDQNIRSLGFRLQDVRLIVTSHEHFDHVGGVAALQRASGAIVASSPVGARALGQGEPTPDDPQYGFGRESTGFLWFTAYVQPPTEKRCA